MTSKTKTQLGVLGALVAVLVTVMFVVSSGQGPAGAPRAASTQPGRSSGAAGVPEVVDVRLESLEADHGAPSDPSRNLFVFRQRQVAASPAPRSQRPEQQVLPVPAGPPPIPPIPLKFIGLLQQNGRKVAIFSDGRGGTFYGRDGDVIDGRYKVIRIGPESTEMSYVDGRGLQTLRLSGQ